MKQKAFLSGIFLLSALLSACGNSSKPSQANEASQTTATQQTSNTKDNMNTIHLTKAEFLAKVYDYEANPKQWKFQGDKPGHRGLLRHLVRPLQGLGTGFGRHRPGIRRQSGHLQSRRGSGTGTGTGFRHTFRTHLALHPGFGRTQHGARCPEPRPAERNHRHAAVEVSDASKRL